MRRFAFVALSFLFAASALAQSTTVFKGLPTIKISESGVERYPEELGHAEAAKFRCVISKIGDRYYWASRDNTLLSRTESGAFVTYVAENGSGYIRIIVPARKREAARAGGPEEAFDYVEHLLLGLSSVTYYGTKWE